MKFDCNHCNYRKTLQGYLTIYIKLVNEELMSDCNQCNYKTTGQGYISCHIKLVHDEVKSDCKQCDNRFDQKKTYLINLCIFCNIGPMIAFILFLK